jgi:hypothetical protein
MVEIFAMKNLAELFAGQAGTIELRLQNWLPERQSPKYMIATDLMTKMLPQENGILRKTVQTHTAPDEPA